MTLGTRAEQKKYLAEVEKYAFDREYFPWVYNGHSVVLVQNDGYIADDGRVFLHLSLSCASCRRESMNRGKLFVDEHLHDRIQTVKMVTLLPYHKHDC